MTFHLTPSCVEESLRWCVTGKRIARSVGKQTSMLTWRIAWWSSFSRELKCSMCKMPTFIWCIFKYFISVYVFSFVFLFIVLTRRMTFEDIVLIGRSSSDYCDLISDMPRYYCHVEIFLYTNMNEIYHIYVIYDVINLWYDKFRTAC